MQITDLFSPMFEARRNPEINKKTGALEALEKYRGKNVYVTFTSDVGSESHDSKMTPDRMGSDGNMIIGKNRNTSGIKIGINPTSEHNTPIGIYAYPVNYVLEKKGNVPFAGSEPFLWVFEPKGKVLDLSTYSKKNLATDSKKINHLDRDGARFVLQGSQKAKIQTPGGMIWNITRLEAMYRAKEKLTLNTERREEAYQDFLGHVWKEFAENDDEYHDMDAAEEAFDQRYDPHFSDEELSNAAQPFWNKIFRKLGYVGVTDSKNEGIIHPNEPTQAVFFSKAGINTLELLHNIEPQEPKTNVEIWQKQPKALMALIRTNRITDEQLNEVLFEYPDLVVKLGFKNLPPAVQEYIRDNALEFFTIRRGFFQMDFGNAGPQSFEMSDKQTIALFAHAPELARTYTSFTPAVEHYVLSNATQFENVFGDLPLTDEQKLQCMISIPRLYNGVYKKNPAPFLQKFMLDNDLVGFRERRGDMTILPENYGIWFKRDVLNGPLKQNIFGILGNLIRETDQGLYFPSSIERSETIFLTCFALLDSRKAIAFVNMQLRDYRRSIGHSLMKKMIALKPAISKLLEPTTEPPIS